MLKMNKFKAFLKYFLLKLLNKINKSINKLVYLLQIPLNH